MKIRRSIFWFCGGIIALLALLVWFNKLAEKATPSQGSAVVETNALVTSQETQPQTTHQIGPSHVTSATNDASASPKSKEKQMLEILSTENDVPIVFYGKLEDQFGNPVAGAEITGNTIIRNGLTEGGGRFTTTSDTVGFFKLDCGKGESLGIMPRKTGYALASLNGGGFYTHLKPESERQHPDLNSPVIVKMWKLQGAEPLLKINQRYRIPFTAEPLHFDLTAGKVVPAGGDIAITVIRSPGIVSERSRQDWGITFGGVDGGVIDSLGSKSVTYWAPDEGYQENESFMFSTNAPNKWLGGFNHDFYIKSRNGQVYAKVALSFYINQNPSDPLDITFTGVANTNGSRNWEGDPNTYRP